MRLQDPRKIAVFKSIENAGSDGVGLNVLHRKTRSIMARDTLRGVLDEFEREGLVERQAGHRGQKRNYWIPAEHRAWYERLSQRLDQLDHEPRLHAELQALVSLRRLATFAIREKLLEPGSIDQLHLRDVEVIYYSLPSWIRKQFLEILRVDTTPHDFEESKKGVWKLVSSMRG